MWARSVGDGAITQEQLAAWPVERPADWTARVNRPQSQDELAALRLCRDRGRPYGDARWTAVTADRLGIESSLRHPGRPRKSPERQATAKNPR